jgi:predicted glycosyltransferase
LKIWIDFINSPQVSFWVPFIKDLKSKNHEFILTCRDSGNTIKLLEQNKLDFHVIGERVGKSLIEKLIFFPQRLIKLYFFIQKHKSDIAVSQSSFYQPIVAFLLNINCLYTNDNEHAKGNIFGFLFAKKVILPIALNNEIFVRRWPLINKVSFYPSVKESIYLSQQKELLPLISNTKSIIYFRPEPWSAEYYNGPLNFFDNTLLSLASSYKIVILPRDMNQVEYYKQEKFVNLTVALKPLNLKAIVGDCLLFIGAGGSMTRELAILGIPVISIYQDQILCVDQYIVNKGKIIIAPKISYPEIINILENNTKINQDFSLLNEGNESYKLLLETIIKLPE